MSKMWRGLVHFFPVISCDTYQKVFRSLFYFFFSHEFFPLSVYGHFCCVQPPGLFICILAVPICLFSHIKTCRWICWQVSSPEAWTSTSVTRCCYQSPITHTRKKVDGPHPAGPCSSEWILANLSLHYVISRSPLCQRNITHTRTRVRI